MAEETTEMLWYVLRAISGKENKVKEYIEAGIKNGNLHGNVSQVLIPTEKQVQVRNGKRVVKEKNYLPGYVLVEARLVGEVTHLLRNTPNVLGFLPNTNQPTPLRESEVNRILGRVDELAEEQLDSIIPFNAGDTVKVVEGPFSGFTGVIEKVDTVKRKVTVTVKVFGRSTGLDLSFLQVEKE
ncbi:MAG: transcription termination/antitermination factor NusG [Alloprevotella sp.]|nr:transcription termination/antitermination factor NusG [Alloprevotella sp.]